MIYSINQVQLNKFYSIPSLLNRHTIKTLMKLDEVLQSFNKHFLFAFFNKLPLFAIFWKPRQSTPLWANENVLKNKNRMFVQSQRIKRAEERLLLDTFMLFVCPKMLRDQRYQQPATKTTVWYLFRAQAQQKVFRSLLFIKRNVLSWSKHQVFVNVL